MGLALGTCTWASEKRIKATCEKNKRFKTRKGQVVCTREVKLRIVRTALSCMTTVGSIRPVQLCSKRLYATLSTPSYVPLTKLRTSRALRSRAFGFAQMCSATRLRPAPSVPPPQSLRAQSDEARQRCVSAHSRGCHGAARKPNVGLQGVARMLLSMWPTRHAVSSPSACSSAVRSGFRSRCRPPGRTPPSASACTRPRQTAGARADGSR